MEKGKKLKENKKVMNSNPPIEISSKLIFVNKKNLRLNLYISLFFPRKLLVLLYGTYPCYHMICHAQDSVLCLVSVFNSSDFVHSHCVVIIVNGNVDPVLLHNF